MMTKKYLIYIALVSIGTVLFSCKDDWEQRNEVQNIDNTVNLSQKLIAQPNFSVFNEYVKATGYDKLLESSQNYTVWAPTNAAIAGLDPAIIASPTKLKDYVANHIALATFPVSKKNDDTIRVKLLNNKYATIIGSKFEEGNIIGEGQFVKNGVLHTLDHAMATKANIWDYILNSTDATLQTNFISNLSTMVIDSVKATIIGYKSNGEPIFAPNPPTIARNTYWVNVADLRDESQQYTYFMLQNAAFTSESAKLATYYPSIDPNFNSSFYLVKDLTVKGLYPVNKLPDTLISVGGVKVPISKAAIVKSYNASNGIVYVVNALPFRLKDKVPEFKIEGEKPFGFSANRTVLYRTKLDDLGKPFNDIEVYNHGVAEFSIFYIKPNLPFVKYKVYAKAIAGLPGDSQVAAFTQRFFVYNTSTVAYTLFYTHLVNPLSYAEVYMGEYTPQQFGLLQFRLTAANSTAKDVSTVILDYLRFEPILP